MSSHLNTQAEFARDFDSVLSASGAFYSHGGEFLPQEQHDAVVGVKRDAFLAKWGPFVVVSSLELRQVESDDVDDDLLYDARCDRSHAIAVAPDVVVPAQPQSYPPLPTRPEPDGFLTIRIIGHEVEVNAYRDSTLEAFAHAAIDAERAAQAAFVRGGTA